MGGFSPSCSKDSPDLRSHESSPAWISTSCLSFPVPLLKNACVRVGKKRGNVEKSRGDHRYAMAMLSGGFLRKRSVCIYRRVYVYVYVCVCVCVCVCARTKSPDICSTTSDGNLMRFHGWAAPRIKTENPRKRPAAACTDAQCLLRK